MKNLVIIGTAVVVLTVCTVTTYKLCLALDALTSASYEVSKQTENAVEELKKIVKTVEKY